MKQENEIKLTACQKTSKENQRSNRLTLSLTACFIVVSALFINCAAHSVGYQELSCALSSLSLESEYRKRMAVEQCRLARSERSITAYFEDEGCIAARTSTMDRSYNPATTCVANTVVLTYHGGAVPQLDRSANNQFHDLSGIYRLVPVRKVWEGLEVERFYKYRKAGTSLTNVGGSPITQDEGELASIKSAAIMHLVTQYFKLRGFKVYIIGIYRAIL